MAVRAIRGATVAGSNTASEIIAATTELLDAMIHANSLEHNSEQIVHAIFTATPDLDAAFPAAAARKMNWTDIPLLDAVEMNVPGALTSCIRVLLTVETDMPRSKIVHVYLREAQSLRPDLIKVADRREE